MARKIEIEITGDAKSLRGALKDAEKDTGKFKGALGGLAKGAAFAGGAAALGGLFAVVKTGVSEFQEAQKVTAQTNAVIKSTGGAANISAKGIEGLAGRLSNLSAVDDEVIQSGANVLLTFTGIRNEVGKGNDVFNQATAAALDMSVALGQDMQSSVVQLGKALNDPIKGITALSRVGVSFTEQQKEQIKTLVESGNVMGAQKLILQELQKEFGGSAEAAGDTFAGQMAKLKLRFEEFSGELIEKAIPYIERFAKFIEEHMPEIKAKADAAFSWIRDNVIPIAKAVGEVWVAAIKSIKKVMDDNGPEIKNILDGIAAVIKTIANVVGPALAFYFENILPPALNAAIKVISAVVTAIDKVVSAFKWIGEHAGPAIKGMWDIAKKPFENLADAAGDVASAIGKIVNGIQWLIKNISRIPDLPDINVPSLPFGIGKDGDRPRSDDLGGGAATPGVDSALWDEIRGGQLMGLQLTSGRRGPRFPGDDSKHISGKAIDMAGAPAAMAAFARWAMQRGNDEVFYDPLGYYMDRGSIVRGQIGGHSDHVHVGSFDQGGWLQPGWTLAHNGTGMPERVGGGGNVYVTVNAPNYVGSQRELADAVQVAAKQFQRDNGRALV